MVNDLSNYLTQKERIETLEKEVQRLTRRNVELKHKCVKLREQLGKKKPLNRTQKALIQIKQVKSDGFEGTVINQIRIIAKQQHLSPNHVQDLWYKN